MKVGDRTKLRILDAGLKLYPWCGLAALARETSLTHAAILYHYQSDRLHDAVAEHAVAVGDSRVIVQLIGFNHPAVADMSDDDRKKHLESCR